MKFLLVPKASQKSANLAISHKSINFQ